MPELPEVETFKRYIDATSLHHTIQSIDVLHKKIVDDKLEVQFETDLINTQFVSTYRQGKYLFLQTTTKKWLIMHFGMTGHVSYSKKQKNTHPHIRFLITFENGYQLAVHNQRLFGKIGFCEDKENYIQRINLGLDALYVSENEFLDILNHRKAQAKSFFLNQTNISGIGNLYADEILFQSRIHPLTPVHQIRKIKRKKIYENMKEILVTAIEKNAEISRYPSSFIIPKRKKGGTCPLHEIRLKTMKINGRTTYFCPIHQRTIKIKNK